MPKLLLAADDLIRHRPKKISHLLGPLGGAGIVPSQLVPGQFEQAIAFAAGTKIGGSDHYDYYRFRTFKPNIWCSYFELWRPQNGRYYYLYRGYLTLLQLSPDHDLRQLVCMHCDPDDESSQPQRSYKQGPHLHICRADAPLPDCHFPLNHCELQRVVRTVASLTRAIYLGVKVLANEVVARY